MRRTTPSNVIRRHAHWDWFEAVMNVYTDRMTCRITHETLSSVITIEGDVFRQCNGEEAFRAIILNEKGRLRKQWETIMMMKKRLFVAAPKETPK